MRYKVGDWEVRTENAARSATQPSRALLSWLEALSPVDQALDYGCGKLRYAGVLAQRSTRLTLVDSAIQLNRTQRILDSATTVRAAATQWPHARALTIDEFETDAQQYDFILCANVLSAIPSELIRSHMLQALAGRLRAGAQCLFVTQYRNSYFTAARTAPDAISHLDGYIVKGLHGHSYYGILPKQKIEQLVTANGLTVAQSWENGQSAFVLAWRTIEQP